MSERINDMQHVKSRMRLLKAEVEYLKRQRDAVDERILHLSANLSFLAANAVENEWADWANDSLSNFDVVWKEEE